jgi:HEAT repeat protein
MAFLVLAVAASWFADRRRLASQRDQVSRQLAIEMKRNLMAAESFEARRKEVSALARRADPRDTPLLLYALTDPDYRVRKVALNALSSMRRRDKASPEDVGDMDAEVKEEFLFWVDVISLARRDTRESAVSAARK